MMVLILSLLLLFAAAPEEYITDTYGTPDIWSTSIGEYVGEGSSNPEMKMLTQIYIDSLEVNLEVTFQELRENYSNAPEMQEYLDQAHQAFLDWVEIWATTTEERMWWRDGIRSDGTARSYTYSATKAAWYWQRIVVYRRWLQIEGVWLEVLEPGNLGCESVGGYLP
jgi:hypothetical protein